MPHATTPIDEQADLDDALIQQTLNDQTSQALGDDFLNRELEPGDKADDAVDYGDLSDDDLADEEEDDGNHAISDILPDIDVSNDNELRAEEVLNSYTGAQKATNNTNEFDDLFGEGLSPVAEDDDGDLSLPFASDIKKSPELPNLNSPPDFTESQDDAPKAEPRLESFEMEDVAYSREEQLQQELFAMSRAGLGNSDLIPHPPENEEELLASLWPKFQRDTIPKFMDLLPSKRVRYIGKAPLKQPKPLPTTKLDLEIAPDDEKNFKISSTASKKTAENMERNGLVVVQGETIVDESSDDGTDADSDFENEPVAGVSWQDFQILCEDWDNFSNASSGSFDRMRFQYPVTDMEWPEAKRQKMTDPENNTMASPLESGRADSLGERTSKNLRAPYLQPGVIDEALRKTSSFREPEAATSRISRNTILDLNDPYILVEKQLLQATKRTDPTPYDRGSSGRDTLSLKFNQRFNISNDEAYDLLKENHQHKVRGMLTNTTIEHSLPARRLQWPFYKTKLDKQEARSFHRPQLKGLARDGNITFMKPGSRKRKELKAMSTEQVFDRSPALSLADNSTALLLEYSEEHPTMLSNLGMGNKIMNYYRRKTAEDNTRPKLDVGDLTVLLPQDKSPYAMFGHIDPGETTPTLHNGMFRAPVFTHEPKGTDFLVIRSHTSGDTKWYLRNIENVRLVGQEFPSVDVPGPHSRKVTTASKNRLKMISYRLLKRTKNHRISVGDVTMHFIDTTDMQNRQKMKEFMQFDKDHKEWKMRPGEDIPDEDAIRSMVRPEDVCLLESMQVGQQHLQDAGFSKDDDNSDEDQAQEGQNIEQLLAPWCTSRNFLHATQNKAMLQLHGDGDPSGRGNAFSFIKTSMKGGFRAVGESVQDKLESKRNKEYGGHSYNVARQQQSYEESIRRIWEAQKQTLSSTVEQSDSEMEDEDELMENNEAVNTPRSDARQFNNSRRFDDETTSQSTRFSNRSQAGKTLQITRKYRAKNGVIETRIEEVRNPRVIRQYLRRRHAREAEGVQLFELKPTGDDEADKRDRARLEKELARLQRNKERRFAREKQKGILHDSPANGDGDNPEGNNGTPTGADGGSASKAVGTQRKCANCGQVGHIKTNKKCEPPPFNNIDDPFEFSFRPVKFF